MIQPAGFVRGMAQGLAQSGAVAVFENSPVISTTREKSAWHVKTPKGAVTAAKVILAVNGHVQSFGASKGTLSGILAAEYAAGIANPYIVDYLAVAQPTLLPRTICHDGSLSVFELEGVASGEREVR